MAVTGKINLDLDAVEAEVGTEDRPPFAFTLNDPKTNEPRRIELKDLRELTWQQLDALGNDQILMLRECMDPDDWAFFRERKVKGRALNVLFKSYRDHYGIDNQGNAAASRY